MRLFKMKIFKNFLFFISAILINIFIFLKISEFSATELYFTFFLNSCFSLYQLIKISYHESISMRSIFWFYGYLFLSVVPYLQYVENQWIFGLTLPEILIANKLILLYFSVYYLSSLFVKIKKNNKFEFLDVNYSNKNHLLSLFFIYVLTFLIIFKGGVQLTKPSFINIFGGYNPISLLLDILVKSFVYFQFIFFLVNCIKSKKHDYVIIFLQFLIFLYYNNPLTLSRFYTFTIFFGTIILLFPSLQKIKMVFFVLLFVGILGSFYQNMLTGIFYPKSDQSESFNVQYFFQGHFDSYENFANTITKTQIEGNEGGRQLIGNLLFWIPREYWPNKPEGSGTYLAKAYYNSEFTGGNLNISSPFIMEEYLNFGTTGIIVLTLLLGVTTLRLDYKFMSYSDLLRSKSCWTLYQINYICYASFIGMFLFFLRGDLLSGLSYSIGIYVSFLIAKKIMFQK